MILDCSRKVKSPMNQERDTCHLLSSGRLVGWCSCCLIKMRYKLAQIEKVSFHTSQHRRVYQVKSVLQHTRYTKKCKILLCDIHSKKPNNIFNKRNAEESHSLMKPILTHTNHQFSQNMSHLDLNESNISQLKAPKAFNCNYILNFCTHFRLN